MNTGIGKLQQIKISEAERQRVKRDLASGINSLTGEPFTDEGLAHLREMQPVFNAMDRGLEVYYELSTGDLLFCKPGAVVPLSEVAHA